MFSEMLLNSQNEIFLEAIDQFFEDESIQNKEKFDSDLTNPLSCLDNIEIERESNIETMNVKFCDSLDELNEIKDLSTDVDSEDFSTNNEKILIKIRECLNINKESINELKKKVYDEAYYQIDLVERIKAIFKPINKKNKEIKETKERKEIKEEEYKK